MIELNLIGLDCPIPVLKTKKFLSQIESETIVKILTSDKASLIDLQDFCSKTGHQLLDQSSENEIITTIIKRR